MSATSSPVLPEQGVRTLASGMLIAQVVALAATPLLTRLYSPAAFGAYALFLAYLTMGAPISALRFDAAIPLPSTDDEAWGLAKLGGLASVAVAAVVGAGSAFAGSALRVWLPLGLLITGLFQVAVAYRVRTARHRDAAAGRAAQGIGTAIAQAGLGAQASLTSGLVLGDLVGRALALLTVLASGGLPRRTAQLASTLGALAGRYRGFATFSSLAAIVNAINGAVPAIVFGAVFGLEATGLLLLAQRVASLPTALLTTAVSQVFAVELARTTVGGRRDDLYRATLRRLVRVSWFVFLGIAIGAPLVFAPVFGPAWRSAGLIATALVPFYFLQLLSGATMSAVDVMQAHRSRLVREIIYLIGMLAALFVAIYAELSLPGVALTYAAFGVLFYVGSLTWVSTRLRTEGAA